MSTEEQQPNDQKPTLVYRKEYPSGTVFEKYSDGNTYVRYSLPPETKPFYVLKYDGK